MKEGPIMEPIKKEHLDKLLKEVKKDKSLTVARHALSKMDIYSIAHTQDNAKEMDFNFSLEVKTLSATNQKASGRCWIFAATNVLREMIAKELNLADFELSQSYIAFYDKLEKLNLTLEIIIELLDKDYDDRTLQFILKGGIGDGGQWDMFVNVVKKYGLCPKNVYGETFTSSSTRYINSLINCEMRKFAAESRHAYEEGGMDKVRALKESYMDRFYKALVTCYGLPQEKFDFEYTDKDNKYHLEKGFTPMSFKEKYLGDRLNDFVSLINAPTKDKPFNKVYTVKYLGNVVGGKQVTHLNVEMKRMKQLIVQQLKDGQITWFGSDVGFYGDRNGGSWDDTRYDYLSLFDLDFKMDKGESLDYRAAQMNHAMVITGVALKNNNPTKWKIENSWGTDIAKGGYFIMSGSWFDQFVFQAVIDKKYLDESELNALKLKPIVLKPWDPMGSLAD